MTRPLIARLALLTLLTLGIQTAQTSLSEAAQHLDAAPVFPNSLEGAISKKSNRSTMFRNSVQRNTRAAAEPETASSDGDEYQNERAAQRTTSRTYGMPIYSPSRSSVQSESYDQPQFSSARASSVLVSAGQNQNRVPQRNFDSTEQTILPPAPPTIQSTPPHSTAVSLAGPTPPPSNASTSGLVVPLSSQQTNQQTNQHQKRHQPNQPHADVQLPHAAPTKRIARRLLEPLPAHSAHSNHAPSNHTEGFAANDLPLENDQENEPSATHPNDLSTDQVWFGTVMEFPVTPDCPSAEIVVHPPAFETGNEYSFEIENKGSADSEPFRVEFLTPPDVTVLQVFPFSAVQSRNRVVVSFDGMVAQNRAIVHIKTTASEMGEFDFKIRVLREQVQSFRVPTDSLDFVAEADLPLDFEEAPNPFQQASTHSRVRDEQPHRPAFELNNNELKLPESYSAKQGRPENQDPSSPTEDQFLSLSLSGEEQLIQGQEYEYEVMVSNPSSKNAHNVIIQLTLPDGLTISNLDRQAWIDKDNRTISWRLKTIGSQQTETIRYQVAAVFTPETPQRIVAGKDNVYQGELEFSPVVVEN